MIIPPLSPTQVALIAIVTASNAVQAARDALVAAGFPDAATMLDHAGSQVYVAMGKVVEDEAACRAQAASGVTS